MSTALNTTKNSNASPHTSCPSARLNNTAAPAAGHHNLIIEHIAQRRRKLDAYRPPTLPFPISHMHRPMRHDLVAQRHAGAGHSDVAISVRHGGSRFVLLNGYGGNSTCLGRPGPEPRFRSAHARAQTHRCHRRGDIPESTAWRHADEFETPHPICARPGARERTARPARRARPRTAAAMPWKIYR